MCFGNLSRQRQSYAAPLGLGGVERYEGIAWIEESRSIIVDRQYYVLVFDSPVYGHLRPFDVRTGSGTESKVVCRGGVKNGFDCIAHEIDQHLLDLIWINHQCDVWAFRDCYGKPGLKKSHTLHDGKERDFSHYRRWHLSQLPICLEKPV